MVRAVFLDRDGVIVIPEFRNGRSYAPNDLNKFKLYPEASYCLRFLKKLNFSLVIVTNQPDVGNGKVSKELVEEMHDIMRSVLPIDLIKVCYHSQLDRCACRKPSSNLLYEAARQLNIELSSSYMVGDRLSDILAGKNAGCQTVFIDRKYCEEAPSSQNFTAYSLTEAVNWIAQHAWPISL